MVKRGDIVWVSLDPVVGSGQGKRRPALVVQHDTLNEYANTTIIVPITSKKFDKTYPMHVPIMVSGKKGTLKVEHIHSVDQSRIAQKIGRASSHTLYLVGKALQYTCDYF